MEVQEIIKVLDETDALIIKVTEETADTKEKIYLLTKIEFDLMVAQMEKLKSIIIHFIKE